MYIIGNIVVGTHLPWNRNRIRQIGQEYMVHLRNTAPQELLSILQDFKIEDPEELMEISEEEFREEVSDLGYAFVEEVLLEEGAWEKNYHGGSDDPSAFVGVEIGSLDETDHIPADELIRQLTPTEQQTAEAREKYDALPENVRKILPPFGVYIVWSSS